MGASSIDKSLILKRFRRLLNFFWYQSERNVFHRMIVFMLIIFTYDLLLAPILDFLFSHSAVAIVTPKNGDNFLIFALLIAPVTEELIFRLPLSFKISHLFISFIFAFVLILAVKSVFVKILIISFYVILVVRIFKWKNLNSIFLIIFSALAFASIHAGNYRYDDLLEYLIFLPFLLSSQFLFGILSGLIRREGFIYCIIFHSSYNALLFCISELWNI